MAQKEDQIFFKSMIKLENNESIVNIEILCWIR